MKREWQLKQWTRAKKEPLLSGKKITTEKSKILGEPVRFHSGRVEREKLIKDNPEILKKH